MLKSEALNDDLFRASLVAARTAELADANERLRDEIARRKRAQEEYQAILAVAMDGFWVVDMEGRFLDVNEAYCRLIGYSRDELLTMRIPDIEAVEQEEDTARHIRQIVETGFNRFETRHRRRDGRIVDFEVSVAYLPGDGGRLFAFGSNITERKRMEVLLRESEERYRGLYESIRDGVARTDIGGKILECNRAYQDMLGYPKEDLMNLSYQQLTPERWHAMEAEIVERQVKARGYSDEYEKEYVRKDGTVFPLSIRVWLIRDEQGKPKGMWRIVRDITERKRAEDELKRYAAQLEAANQELESFSYSVSHDLRVPLRAIDGFSRILLEDYRDRLDDEGRRMLNVVRDSTRKMGQLIDDILSFSRTGRQEMTLAEVNMEALAGDVFEELKSTAAGRTLQMAIRALPPAFADPAMMRRVWGNLLANAVKFTRPKPAATIEVGGWAGEKENVYYVQDNGVGFDMRYVGKLFGVFQRLHGADEFEGTGIGLAIVKRIVARHGGRVWAEGRVNEGATFYFGLPAKEEGRGQSGSK